MDAYRIGSRAHPLLDGAGAAGSDDARWNSRGRYVVYAAEHSATALLEKAAQLNAPKIPRTLVYVRITVPSDVSTEEVRGDDLPGWDADDKAASRSFGDRWYDETRSLLLLVPSLAAPGLERNVLINQRHPEFARVTMSRPESIRCHPKLLA
ncbi:MAG: RES domain-containing protein [Acidobacteria bacterium]|nr:RES domain-containing protein [Acidobacteriota bacterium]